LLTQLLIAHTGGAGQKLDDPPEGCSDER
jgi:hypothetical protein